MKRATIHVGLPKCGSSDLQVRLATNSSKLMELGYYYPDPMDFYSGEEGRRFRGSHMQVSVELARAERFSKAAKGFRKLCDHFRAIDQDHLLLSSEGFVQRSMAGGFRTAVGTALEGVETTLVAFIRRHDKLVLSGYKQVVKDRRRYTGTFDEFVTEPPHYARGVLEGDMVVAIRNLEITFDAKRSFVFSLDGEGADTATMFGGVVGLDMDALQADPSRLGARNALLVSLGKRANTSFGDYETQFLRYCNRLDLEPEQDAEIKLALTRVETGDLAEGYSLMTPELARRLADEAVARYEALDREFGLKPPDDIDVPIKTGSRSGDLSASEIAEIRERIAPHLAQATAEALKAGL